MNEDIIIREIKEEDLSNGFLESLDSLRRASDLKKDKALAILNQIKSNPYHLIFVAEKDGRVVGSTTLLIEPKFIHKGGLVGHIEDVVVASHMQGQGIGKKLVETCLKHAKEKGCYKTILDCSDELKRFYEKLGFIHCSNGMRFEH